MLFLHFSDYQDFDSRNKIGGFSIYCLVKIWKRSVETMMEDIKLVVIEMIEF